MIAFPPPPPEAGRRVRTMIEPQCAELEAIARSGRVASSDDRRAIMNAAADLRTLATYADGSSQWRSSPAQQQAARAPGVMAVIGRWWSGR